MDIPTKYFRKETNCVTRVVAGETIIVPIRDRVGDLDSVYTLNEVGSLIWKLVDGRTGLNQMVEEIHRTYDVEPEEAEKDAVDFLDSLAQVGLVRLTLDEPPARP